MLRRFRKFSMCRSTIRKRTAAKNCARASPKLYPGAKAENVLVTCGGSEANFISTWALIEPGDEIVFMMPNYMQIAGLARSFGATVKPLWLREELQWGIDIGELPRLIGPKTKLMAICNPSNPTGSVLRKEERAGNRRCGRKSGRLDSCRRSLSRRGI